MIELKIRSETKDFHDRIYNDLKWGASRQCDASEDRSPFFNLKNEKNIKKIRKMKLKKLKRV